MNPVALPKLLEDAVQEMERRGAEASGKLDEAVKALDESADDVIDFDDPSVVRHVDDLRRTSTRLRSITDAPLAVIDPEATPVATPRRLVRPPRRPPTRG